MDKIIWKKADSFTINCFNRYGINPYNAILTTSLKNKDSVRYDLTILKHDNGSFIPVHGGMLMNPVSKLKIAKKIIIEWVKDEFNKQNNPEYKY